jgi:DNA-binding transcriptional ArsR family regulator
MSGDHLSTTFAALADPTRRAILARLAAGECSVTELAQPFDMSMPAVSKHLRVLEQAGLITRRHQAQWRWCRIEAAPLQAVAEWAEHYRRLWERRLDRLDQYREEIKTNEKANEKANQKAKEKRHGRKQRRK